MNLSLKLSITASYVFMITLNILANAIPINNITTGQISNNYQNLFAPAGATFSIWGVIYIALFAYVIAVWMNQKNALNNQIGLFFIVSSLLNGLWILAWHYDLILLSVFIMLGLLFSLIKIAYEIKEDELDLRLYFHIYFGWITVATIANITILLVSFNWSFFSAAELWTVLILWVGVVISLITAHKFKSVIYMLTLIWAYAGIAIQHTSFFNQSYTYVILSVWGSLAVFASMVIYLMYPKIKPLKHK